MSAETSRPPENLTAVLVEVAHGLAAVQETARTLAATWRGDPAAGERAVAEMIERTGEALARVQSVLPEAAADGDDPERDPVWLDGLPAALRRLARETGTDKLRVEVALRGYTPPPAGSLGRTRDEHLYRIAKAALLGVASQGRATEATLLLSQERGRLELKVVDDAGFEPGTRGRGRGGPELAEIRDHAAALGGRLKIASSPGGGTILTVTIYEEPKAG